MTYEFNNLKIDTEKFVLFVNDKEQSVEPQVFNLILYLVKNRDRIVSRDELLDNIWEGRIVSDTSVSNSIKSARKALGDDGVKQQVIKTIHSRGYQFVADTQNTQESTVTASTFKRLSLLFSFFAVISLLLFFTVKQIQHNTLKNSVQKIADYQQLSYLTFVAQAKRRNELVDMIQYRTGENRDMQFEKYFSYYFEQLSDEEKFVFDQIRSMTEVGLYENNQKTVEILKNNPEIITLIQGTKELREHLEFWLNKYNGIFQQRQDMCILYVGVEDGVPYPIEVNKNLKAWLEKNK